MEIPDVRNATPVGKKTTAPINPHAPASGWLERGKMLV